MKYEVHHGDSPWKIALALTGDGYRWKELLLANPGKARTPEGSFAELRARELLNVPDSWTSGMVVNSTSKSSRSFIESKEPRAAESSDDSDSGSAWSTPSWEEP